MLPALRTQARSIFLLQASFWVQNLISRSGILHQMVQSGAFLLGHPYRQYRQGELPTLDQHLPVFHKHRRNYAPVTSSHKIPPLDTIIQDQVKPRRSLTETITAARRKDMDPTSAFLIRAPTPQRMQSTLVLSQVLGLHYRTPVQMKQVITKRDLKIFPKHQTSRR
jgi:hypothetical protein